MIVIAFTRAVLAGVTDSKDHIWIIFWPQMEASISVIAICPTALRSFYLTKNLPKRTPNNDQVHASVLKRIWRRQRPSLKSINVQATLTGMRTLIRDNGRTQLESRNDNGCVSSSQSTHSGLGPHATERSAEETHEEAATIA